MAPGQRPNRSGYSASGRASPPPSSRSQTNRSASARHGESPRQTFPNRTESAVYPEPKDHVDPGRREIAERVRVPEERRHPRPSRTARPRRPGRRSAADRERRATRRLPACGRPAASPQSAAATAPRAGRTRRRGRSPRPSRRATSGTGRSWTPPIPCATKKRRLRASPRAPRGAHRSGAARPRTARRCSARNGSRTALNWMNSFSML